MPAFSFFRKQDSLLLESDEELGESMGAISNASTSESARRLVVTAIDEERTYLRSHNAYKVYFQALRVSALRVPVFVAWAAIVLIGVWDASGHILEMTCLSLSVSLCVLVDTQLAYYTALEIRRRYRDMLDGMELLSAGSSLSTLRCMNGSCELVHVRRDREWKPMPKVLATAREEILSRRTLGTSRVALRESCVLKSLFHYIRTSCSTILPPPTVEPLAAQAQLGKIPNNAIYPALSRHEFENTECELQLPSPDERPRSTLPGHTLPTFMMRMEHLAIRAMLLCIALLCTLVGVVHGIVWGAGNYQYTLSAVGHIAVGFTPIHLLLVERFITLYGNAWLVCMFRAVSKSFLNPPANGKVDARACHRGSTVSLTLNDGEELVSLPSIPIREVLRSMKRMAFSDKVAPNTSIVFAQNPVHTLGTMTVVAVLDKVGILSEVLYCPVELLFIKTLKLREKLPPHEVKPARSESDEFAVLEGDDAASDHEDRKAPVRRTEPAFHEQHFTTISLVLDATAAPPLQFATKIWKNHMEVLKPIGWGCLVQSIFAASEVTDASSAQSYMDATVTWAKYLHLLGEAIGFDQSTAGQFKVLRKIHVFQKCAESDEDDTQQACSLVVEDTGKRLQLLTLGSPQVVLDCSGHYWDGDDVLELVAEDKRELVAVKDNWRRTRNLLAVAVAHRPIPAYMEAEIRRGRVKDIVRVVKHNPSRVKIERSQSFETLTPGEEKIPQALTPPASAMRRREETADIWKTLHEDLVMLGIVGLEQKEKPFMDGFVHALSKAGIRFMHFDKSNEFLAKAFGQRLGLETDWNCCISLSEQRVVIDPHDLRSQMPYGIAKLRSHIVNVDRVPLTVSLFCDCTPKATKEMLSVLQDNHEIVGAVYSSYNYQHVLSARQGDMAFCVKPTVAGPLTVLNESLRSIEDEEDPPGLAVTELVGGVTTFQFQSSNSTFPTLLVLLHQARVLLGSMAQCLRLVFSSIHAVGTLQVVSALLFTPPVLRVGHMVCLYFLVVPVLCYGIFHHEESLSVMRVMHMMPNKYNHSVRMRILLHLYVIFFARCGLGCAIIFFSYCVLLSRLGAYTGGSPVWNTNTPQQSDAIASCQNFAFFSTVIFLAQNALCFLSRHQRFYFPSPVRRESLTSSKTTDTFRIWRHPKCVVSVLVCIVTAAMYLLASVPFTTLQAVPWWLWLVTLIGLPVGGLVCDDVVKRWRVRTFLQLQKFRALDFHTKLGMHSPCGDWEDSPANAALPQAPTETYSSAALIARYLHTLMKKYFVCEYMSEENCVCCDHDL